MKRKSIEKNLKQKIAKYLFFAITTLLSFLSYVTEMRPLVNLAWGSYFCGLVDGFLFCLSALIAIFYFWHKI
jgi:hypothetical protein